MFMSDKGKKVTNMCHRLVVNYRVPFHKTREIQQLVWYLKSHASGLGRICLRCDQLLGPCMVAAWYCGRSLEPFCCSLPLLLLLFVGVTCFRVKLLPQQHAATLHGPSSWSHLRQNLASPDA